MAEPRAITREDLQLDEQQPRTPLALTTVEELTEAAHLWRECYIRNSFTLEGIKAYLNLAGDDKAKLWLPQINEALSRTPQKIEQTARENVRNK